jgi:cytochrome c553
VKDWAWPGWKAGAAIVATTLFVVGAVVFLVAVSGVYSVAASKGHFLVTRLFLEIGMRRSVSTHSLGVAEPPPLADPDRIRLGASAFQGGCAICHGSPIHATNPIALGMLPSPPDLREQVRKWSPEELFWIVKNGIKYTGMPAWPTQDRDDEVWSMVAFLLKLPELDAAAYLRLAEGPAAPRKEKPAGEIARDGTGQITLAVCARCHGDENTGPDSRLVPKLAGLPVAYLEQELTAYAQGLRSSGIMQPVAAELSGVQIRQLAEYYAGIPPQPHADTAAPDSARIARGAEIAASGVPGSGVPACIHCHGGAGLPAYPTLHGQHARYIAQQLELWQSGLRAETAPGQVMAPIASRLTAEQIEDLAAYFASLGANTTAQSQ